MFFARFLRFYSSVMAGGALDRTMEIIDLAHSGRVVV